MEIRLKEFIVPNKITALLNFKGEISIHKNSKKVAYITNHAYKQNSGVLKYLERNYKEIPFSKIEQAFKMVNLKEDVLKNNLLSLSFTETKKLRFVEALLSNAENFVFVNFSEGFYQKSKDYYQKLSKKLLKYGKSILFVTNDVSFLLNFVSNVTLYYDNQFLSLEDFYDNRIYECLEMPEIIFFVKYLQKKGVQMESYTETKEVLKAIYRSVNSGEHL